VSRLEALIYYHYDRYDDRHDGPASTPTGEPPLRECTRSYVMAANQFLGDQLLERAAFDHHDRVPGLGSDRYAVDTSSPSNSECFT
jgi:hypothetical protein